MYWSQQSSSHFISPNPAGLISIMGRRYLSQSQVETAPFPCPIPCGVPLEATIVASRQGKDMLLYRPLNDEHWLPRACRRNMQEDTLIKTLSKAWAQHMLCKITPIWCHILPVFKHLSFYPVTLQSGASLSLCCSSPICRQVFHFWHN